MWTHNYTPLAGNLGLSALVAAVPIFTLVLLLGVLRKPTWIAALCGLGAGVLTSILLYGMPITNVVGAVTYGAAQGLFPIGWVVFTAILLYRITQEQGKFEIIKDSVGSSHRGPALAGAADCVRVRRVHRRSVGIRNAGRGSGGDADGVGILAVLCRGHLPARQYLRRWRSDRSAIPITTLAQITGLPMDRSERGRRTHLRAVSLFVPAYLMMVMGGWKALRGVLPAAVVCGVAFAGMQFVSFQFRGRELTDILASLADSGAAGAAHAGSGSRRIASRWTDKQPAGDTRARSRLGRS